MKKYQLFMLIVALNISIGNTNAQQNNSEPDSAAMFQALQLQQTDRKAGSANTHPDAQWFPQAGLGLFIHWGMTAVNATGDLSWNMLANKPWKDATITPNNYYKQLDKWVPDKIDFDKMLKAAKAAGVTYAVFVTRHHDGFTLWPSEFGEIGTKTHFGGRDFVKEFVEACRKNKLRVGLYYSPPDWYYERKYKNFAYRLETLDMDHKPTVLPEKTPEYERRRHEHLKNQVTELLSNYGKIDLMWFDGGRGEVPNKLVRTLQPGIVINRRNGAEGGDYGDTEGVLPQKRFSGWFETCETCWPSRKWAYTEDAGWDTAAEVITSLVKLRAWGGNLLANVGPKASGEVPQQALSAWNEMAKWMKHSRESVIGANAGPWPADVNTPVTTNDGVAYIHLLPGEDVDVVWKNAPEPKKAFMLKSKKPVAFTYENGTLKMRVLKDNRTNNVDVVKLILMPEISLNSNAQPGKAQLSTSEKLESEFLTPPDQARPLVWWHWLGSNFSKEGITKDLEAMKESGIGGATIFNISSSVVESHMPTLNNPWPDQTYRSPNYWDAMRHAASEAKRLGLEVGLHNTVGYSTTGGPWIDEERSMQRVVWSETTVTGGQKVNVKLAAPEFVSDEGWGYTGRKVSWYKDFAVLAIPAGKTEIKLAEILNITTKMDAKGKLNWNAPEGNWLVYRLAHASTGRPPHPVPDDLIGKVLEADKMSLKQTKYHWNQVIEPMKKHLGDLLGSTGMKHFLIDSYEAGFQNWTPNFRKEFKKLKGYDPLPWLMTFNTVVLNGKKPATEENTLYPRQKIIESAELSARFETDYRDVIRRLFYDNGWKPASKMINAVGMTVQHEAYGGPFGTVEGSALADLPMCEFWTGRNVHISPTIIGSARAAGKNIIGAEALTGSPTQSKWTEVPSFLKYSLDAAYADGVNLMILHHWVHQPFDDKYKPGLGMGWWGTHFSRHQTWFEQGKAFFLYMSRIQTMLQKGETTIHTLSVGGNAGGTDFISQEAFLNDVETKNGKVILPSGRSYFVLHIPHEGKLSPEMIAKIDKLLHSGATIVSSKPTSSPGLSGYPHSDTKVKEMAMRTWGISNEEVRKIGKGTLYTDGSRRTVQKALTDLGCVQPFKKLSSNQDVRILHRTNGKESWYFVANIGNNQEKVVASFAVSGMLPELWDAETGSITVAPVWRKKDSLTEVDIVLPKHKSLFVVFRKPIPHTTDQLTAVDASDDYKIISKENGIVLIESENAVNGTFHFASGKTKQFTLSASNTIDLNGEWDVSFNPSVGKKFSAKFPKLQSLEVNPATEIKYFSGTAIYKMNVDVPQTAFDNGQLLELDLGEVYDMATVTINGISHGVWWSPPFTGDITKLMKPGLNSIEIAVTNSWHNLLVGDEQHPADFEWGVDRNENGRMMKGYPEWFLKNEPRKEQNRKGFVIWYYHRKETPLKRAGLVGPVRIISKSPVSVKPD